MADSEDDYKVGYRRPPKWKQFQKGESGNPSGRPKGAKNIAGIVDKVCREPVRVKGEDGKYYEMPKIEVIIKQLTNSAAKGDIKATRMCLDIFKMFPSVTEAPPLAPPIFHVHFVEAEDGRPKIKKDSSASEGHDKENAMDDWRAM